MTPCTYMREGQHAHGHAGSVDVGMPSAQPGMQMQPPPQQAQDVGNGLLQVIVPHGMQGGMQVAWSGVQVAGKAPDLTFFWKILQILKLAR